MMLVRVAATSFRADRVSTTRSREPAASRAATCSRKSSSPPRKKTLSTPGSTLICSVTSRSRPLAPTQRSASTACCRRWALTPSSTAEPASAAQGSGGAAVVPGAGRRDLDGSRGWGVGSTRPAAEQLPDVEDEQRHRGEHEENREHPSPVAQEGHDQARGHQQPHRDAGQCREEQPHPASGYGLDPGEDEQERGGSRQRDRRGPGEQHADPEDEQDRKSVV